MDSQITKEDEEIADKIDNLLGLDFMTTVKIPLCQYYKGKSNLKLIKKFSIKISGKITEDKEFEKDFKRMFDIFNSTLHLGAFILYKKYKKLGILS